MCLNALKTQVRVLMSSIQQIIARLPVSKQEQHKLMMQQLMKKYNPSLQEDLQKLQKDLSYKINFLRLSHPSVFKSTEGVPTPSEEANPYFTGISDDVADKQREEDQQESDAPITGGSYVMKDGKLTKGEATKREQVEWSNWFAANVDPEDLKRHKELLDRQHFGGPVWKGRPLPKSIIDEESPRYEAGTSEINPALNDTKESTFEQVKR